MAALAELAEEEAWSEGPQVAPPKRSSPPKQPPPPNQPGRKNSVVPNVLRKRSVVQPTPQPGGAAPPQAAAASSSSSSGKELPLPRDRRRSSIAASAAKARTMAAASFSASFASTKAGKAAAKSPPLGLANKHISDPVFAKAASAASNAAAKELAHKKGGYASHKYLNLKKNVSTVDAWRWMPALPQEALGPRSELGRRAQAAVPTLAVGTTVPRAVRPVDVHDLAKPPSRNESNDPKVIARRAQQERARQARAAREAKLAEQAKVAEEQARKMNAATRGAPPGFSGGAKALPSPPLGAAAPMPPPGQRASLMGFGGASAPNLGGAPLQAAEKKPAKKGFSFFGRRK